MSGSPPAFPGIELNGNGESYATFFGLTKRELFTVMAMQGLLAAGHKGLSPDDVSRLSRSYANALIKDIGIK